MEGDNDVCASNVDCGNVLGVSSLGDAVLDDLRLRGSALGHCVTAK